MLRGTVHFRLMTYNVGGGRKDAGSNDDEVLEVIESLAPDILAAQEVAERQDAEGHWHRMSARIRDTLGCGENFFLGPTLSMREDFHVRKTLFVNGLFSDWSDWRQGNALFSKRPFVRLGNASLPGRAVNIPLYRSSSYDGTRDTDSRYAVLARTDQGLCQPFVVNAHLTTLIGERGGKNRLIPGKTGKAQEMRKEQSQALITLVQTHVLEKGELAFLLGDFNATAREECISNVLLGNQPPFVRLVPTNDSLATHQMKGSRPVDHIFVCPGERRIEYKCWIPDSAVIQRASDHRPVVADVTVYEAGTERFQTLGPGVVRSE